MTSRIILVALPIAALGALGLSAIAATSSAPGSGSPRQLDDIQIGERGDVLRVALVCRGRCDVAPSTEIAGAFQIKNIEEQLSVDLSGRSAHARRLTLTPNAGGSLVTLETDATLNAAQVTPCKTEGGLAACIDYRFARAPKAAGAPAISPTEAAAPVERAKEPSRLRSEAQTPSGPAEKTAAPFIGAIMLTPNAGLREGPDAAAFIPDFAPPERFDPRPAPPPGQRSIPAPEIKTTLKERLSAPTQPRQRFDFAREANAILGHTADPARCEGAAARLSADAWALDAMVDVAFCNASAGALEDADNDFARLLAYTPDNHLALVGRGLIAMARGERQRGLDFLQEALNALPPIAESDRIAAAMDRY
ncbi:MAG: hypothetical protein ACKVS5_16615 [Parvularculaceae bacterium]